LISVSDLWDWLHAGPLRFNLVKRRSVFKCGFIQAGGYRALHCPLIWHSSFPQHCLEWKRMSTLPTSLAFNPADKGYSSGLWYFIRLVSNEPLPGRVSCSCTFLGTSSWLCSTAVIILGVVMSRESQNADLRRDPAPQSTKCCEIPESTNCCEFPRVQMLRESTKCCEIPTSRKIFEILNTQKAGLW
jgi:hypothetical protein